MLKIFIASIIGFIFVCLISTAVVTLLALNWEARCNQKYKEEGIEIIKAVSVKDKFGSFPAYVVFIESYMTSSNSCLHLK